MARAPALARALALALGPAGCSHTGIMLTAGQPYLDQGPRVCWLGPERQGTPNHTFLAFFGSQMVVFQVRFLVMGRCLRQTPPQKSDFWDSHNVPVWKSHRACGRRAGGGRSRQLRPHWCPPTHPRLLSPCWGGPVQPALKGCPPAGGPGGQKKNCCPFFGSKNSPNGSGRPVASISPVQMLKTVAWRPI